MGKWRGWRTAKIRRVDPHGRRERPQWIRGPTPNDKTKDAGKFPRYGGRGGFRICGGKPPPLSTSRARCGSELARDSERRQSRASSLPQQTPSRAEFFPPVSSYRPAKPGRWPRLRSGSFRILSVCFHIPSAWRSTPCRAVAMPAPICGGSRSHWARAGVGHGVSPVSTRHLEHSNAGRMPALLQSRSNWREHEQSEMWERACSRL